jgi:hypothetical protein
MTKLKWDQVGEKVYETGVSNGVLYKPNSVGVYDEGFPWNGLTAVTESPSGAESTKTYADNRVYANMISVEEFGATVEAYTYPDEFAECDGTATPAAGVYVGQQTRKPFGLSYQTLIGNDIDGTDFGHKVHLVYNALAKPTEKAFSTINDSTEGMTLSWELTTTPVDVPGLKPTALLTIDSTKVDAGDLAALEDILYGTVGTDPRLPTPAEVISLFNGTLTEVAPGIPTYDNATHTLTIPSTTGVIYSINDVVVAAGPIVITEDTVVTAAPEPGYKFPTVTDDDWLFDYS